MPKRFDVGQMLGVERTDAGYLRADSRISRVGVFNYMTQDGTIRRELRPPEEVFSKDSVASFELVPMTDDHPKEALNVKTTKAHQVGVVSSVHQDERFLSARIQIQDEETIRKVENGKRQLSCGYSCELEFKEGVTDGIEGVQDGLKFDAIQRNIRGNHVALVQMGRAGSDVALRMDAEDAFEVEEQKTKGGPAMALMKIDGVDFEMTEQAVQAVSKVLEKADAAEKAAKEASKALAEVEAKADAKSEEVDALKAKLEAKSDEAEIRKAVDARLGLERIAANILGGEVKLDGMSSEEIQKAVVLKVSPAAKEKLDSASEAYLEARFDSAVELFEAKKAEGNRDAVNGVGVSGKAPSTKMDAASARARMIESLHSQGSQPLKA